jgi:tRNA pseudouridine55 synthase
MDFRKGEIIAIDKPYRMSSFGALAHVRYLLSKKLGFKVKIGHAGTLDPLATGVLVLCTGKCTKQIEQLQTHTKEYTATLQLGATTASYDKEHSVNHTYPTKHITRQLVEETPPAKYCRLNVWLFLVLSGKFRLFTYTEPAKRFCL